MKRVSYDTLHLFVNNQPNDNNNAFDNELINNLTDMTSSPPQLSPSGTNDTFIEGDARLHTPRNRRSIDSLCDIGPSLLLGQHSHFSSTIVPEHEGQAIVGCTSDALERRATLTLERATSGFTRDINGDPQAHDPPLLAPLDALAEAATLTRPPLRKSVDWRDIIGIGEDRRRDDQNGLLASRPEEKQGAKYSERVDRNITNNVSHDHNYLFSVACQRLMISDSISSPRHSFSTLSRFRG